MNLDSFSVEFDGKEYPCFFVRSATTALEVIKQLLTKDSIVACDLETAPLPRYKFEEGAALSPFLGKPRLLQLFTGTGAVVIDLFHAGPIDLALFFHSRPTVFHNMTFDYKMLREHYGVVSPDMHCTCIMARCVFHAIYPEDKPADLGSVVKTFFGEKVNKKAGRSDWSGELTFEQIKYAATDVIILMELFKKLNTYIDQLHLRTVYDLYRKAQLVLSEMELNGISIDRQLHLKNIVRWREELKDAEDEVLKLTGLQRITDKTLADWLVNSLPPETLEVWPRTEKEGRLATDAHTFADFSHLEIVKPFSRYQKLKKLTTAFGMRLLSQLNPATGKIHPSYRVAGARTGRLSCAEPNIQNSPRDKSFRSVFVPSPGYVLVVADYSQVEVRCIAEYSNDPKMLEAYEEGLDIYTYTAAHLMGKPMEEVKTNERQQAKALVLGLNYGLGAKKFQHYARKGYEVEMSAEESDIMVRAYRDLYSRLREWQMEQADMCVARKYTAWSALGKSRKMTDENYFCACMNHPIQGSCAEIMLLALVYVHEELKGTSARMLASVHDEIVVECLPEDIEQVTFTLQCQMLKAYLAILPSGRTVKKLVKPTYGENWANAKG